MFGSISLHGVTLYPSLVSVFIAAWISSVIIVIPPLICYPVCHIHQRGPDRTGKRLFVYVCEISHSDLFHVTLKPIAFILHRLMVFVFVTAKVTWTYIVIMYISSGKIKLFILTVVFYSPSLST